DQARVVCRGRGLANRGVRARLPRRRPRTWAISPRQRPRDPQRDGLSRYRAGSAHRHGLHDRPRRHEHLRVSWHGGIRGHRRRHEWMFRKGPDAEIDLGVRREFVATVGATVGATVIGRRTFDVGVGPWGGTPWPGMPSFVVTHRTQLDLLGKNGGTFAFDGLE